MFRPSGTTPGHWLEWSRLLMQLWVLGERQHDWLPEAAQSLFHQSISIGWDDKHGGFFYNLDWDDKPDMRHKLWWPASEGAAAAAFLMEHVDDPLYESWYRNIWDVIARHHIDETNGGWHEQLTEDMKPAYSLFAGKGDIYHALQACLIPLFPATGSITKGIIETGGEY